MSARQEALLGCGNRIWRDRRFILVSGTILALGLALATLGFAIFYSFLLKPLPYPDANRLVVFRQIIPAYGLFGYYASEDLYSQLEQESEQRIKALSLVTINRRTAISSINGELRVIHYLRATPSFFSMLSKYPTLGRWPSRAAGHKDGPREAVISYSFWKRAFNKDPSAMGSEIPIKGKYFQVVGIFAKNFHTEPLSADLYMPLVQPFRTQDVKTPDKVLLGILRPGSSLRSLQPLLSSIAQEEIRKIPSQFRNQVQGYHIIASPIRDYLLHKARMHHLPWMYLGLGLFLWVIAVLNVANYAMLRHQSALRKYAIRQLLGASSWTLARLLLSEQIPMLLLSLVLAIPLYILGMRWVSTTLFSGRSYSIFLLHGAWLTWPFLLALLTLSSFTILVFPLWRLRPATLKSSLNSDERISTPSKTLQRAFQWLGTLQVSLAIGLLSASLSLAFGGFSLDHRPLGFQSKDVAYSKVYFANNMNTIQSWHQIEDGLQNNPYVKKSALSMSLPLVGKNENISNLASTTKSGRFLFDVVTRKYFSILKIPIEEGQRMPDNTYGSSSTIWADTELCKNFFGSERCSGSYAKEPHLLVGGVMKQTAWNLVPYKGSLGFAYLPLNTSFSGLNGDLQEGYLLLKIPIDSNSSKESVLSTLRHALPGAIFTNLREYHDLIKKARVGNLNFDIMLGVFALLSTGISLFGIYTMQSYIQSGRMPEYRTKRILGAQNRYFYKKIGKDILLIVWPGVFIGGSVAVLLVHAASNDFPYAMHFISMSLLLSFIFVSIPIAISYYGTMRRLLGSLHLTST